MKRIHDIQRVIRDTYGTAHITRDTIGQYLRLHSLRKMNEMRRAHADGALGTWCDTLQTELASEWV